MEIDHICAGRPRRAARSVCYAIGIAMLVLAGCAGTRVPDNPDARACLPPASEAMRSRDYTTRLAGYTQRADAFAVCMTQRGYVLDEQTLDARVLHFEQVKNANPYGGDPTWAKRIEREKLRVDPALWKKSQG